MFHDSGNSSSFCTLNTTFRASLRVARGFFCFDLLLFVLFFSQSEGTKRIASLPSLFSPPLLPRAHTYDRDREDERFNKGLWKIKKNDAK